MLKEKRTPFLGTTSVLDHGTWHGEGSLQNLTPLVQRAKEQATQKTVQSKSPGDHG